MHIGSSLYLKMIYTEKYDKQLSTFPIYKLYLELIPLIGTHVKEVEKALSFYWREPLYRRAMIVLMCAEELEKQA